MKQEKLELPSELNTTRKEGLYGERDPLGRLAHLGYYHNGAPRGW